MQVTEQPITENDEIMKISDSFADFLASAHNLESFCPGLFVTDRSHEDYEPHTLSLCYSSPRVIINLVKNCPNLNTLSLYGYEDLSDIVLTYIRYLFFYLQGVQKTLQRFFGTPCISSLVSSGEAGHCPGLLHLSHITLPDRSYISEHGVISLLKHLPRLNTLEYPGNMGKVFDLSWEPVFGESLALTNFSQLMTVSSGGVEVIMSIILDVYCPCLE